MNPETKPTTEPSPGEFLNRLGVEIQSWLHGNITNENVRGKQWVLYALLANGEKIIAHELSVSGFALIKIVGQKEDGTPCIVAIHQNSAQFLATYIAYPSESELPVKREIGFHATIAGKKIITPEKTIN